MCGSHPWLGSTWTAQVRGGEVCCAKVGALQSAYLSLNLGSIILLYDFIYKMWIQIMLILRGLYEDKIKKDGGKG